MVRAGGKLSVCVKLRDSRKGCVAYTLADIISIVQLASNAPLLPEGLLRFFMGVPLPLMSALLLPSLGKPLTLKGLYP